MRIPMTVSPPAHGSIVELCFGGKFGGLINATYLNNLSRLFFSVDQFFILSNLKWKRLN